MLGADRSTAGERASSKGDVGEAAAGGDGENGLGKEDSAVQREEAGPHPVLRSQGGEAPGEAAGVGPGAGACAKTLAWEDSAADGRAEAGGNEAAAAASGTEPDHEAAQQHNSDPRLDRIQTSVLYPRTSAADGLRVRPLRPMQPTTFDATKARRFALNPCFSGPGLLAPLPLAKNCANLPLSFIIFRKQSRVAGRPPTVEEQVQERSAGPLAAHTAVLVRAFFFWWF